MNHHPLQCLLLMLWLALTSLSLFADNQPQDPLDHPSETQVTDEQSVWDKTKEMGSKTVQSGKALGAAAADKTSTLYQGAKKKGQQAGAVIAGHSRNAWHKTKQMGTTIANKTREWSTAITEKSRSLYNQATQPEDPTQTANSGKNI